MDCKSKPWNKRLSLGINFWALGYVNKGGNFEGTSQAHIPVTQALAKRIGDLSLR